MVASLPDEHVIEARIRNIGEHLLQRAREGSGSTTITDRWLRQFLQRIMESEAFRVRALRFIDVLPTLDDDSDLVDHLQEYFSEEDSPFRGLLIESLRHTRTRISDSLIAITVRKAVESIARHFICATSSKDVLKRITDLRKGNILFSLDHLGEATVSEVEAERYQALYMDLITGLSAQMNDLDDNALLDTTCGRRSPRLNLSIKVSSLYSQMNRLDMDGTINGIAQRLRPVFHAAKQSGAFVCLDMEQYDLKGIILACFKRLLMEEELRNWADAGLAMQTYLRDTENDLTGMVEWAEQRGTPVTVRLVRGAYWDYETIIAKQCGWPPPVWTSKSETDMNYERCLRLLFARYPIIEIAVATHNVRSIAMAMALAEQYCIPPEDYEFQLLYGMAAALEYAIASNGNRLRIYLPFGELIPGMSYLTRRLLENVTSQSFQRMTAIENSAPEELLAIPVVDKAGSAAAPEKNNERDSSDNEIREFNNEPPFRFIADNEIAGYRHAIDRVRSEAGQFYPLLINGREVETEKKLVSVNPAYPKEVIGHVACAGREHADAALQGASEALADWTRLDHQERARILIEAARRLREQRTEFAALEILEAGKTWREADANIIEAIDFLEFYAREAIRLGTGTTRNVDGENNHSDYRPRGIAVVIPPWNFPLAILTGMLSAAIVTGNTAILKPSSQTPVIAARFVNLLRQAGLPDGVVQFLPGAGGEVGNYLVTHPQINLIAFTGSMEVGTGIIRSAADISTGQHHIRHVIAEMGGKNALIIDSDADLDDAVIGTIHSAFGYQGQKCSAASRVIVVGRHYDHFLERLVEATRSMVIGKPEHPGVFIGPVISRQAQKRIMQCIERGQAEAEQVLQVEYDDPDNGYYVGPTIFSHVKNNSFLAQEEIFGPVLSVLLAADLDEAVAIANASRYALTGGMYSRNPEHIERVKTEMQVGNLYINRKITGAMVERQPFGGYKLSGLGSKAGGRDYLYQYMLPRTVTENTMRRGYAPGEDIYQYRHDQVQE